MSVSGQTEGNILMCSVLYPPVKHLRMSLVITARYNIDCAKQVHLAQTCKLGFGNIHFEK